MKTRGIGTMVGALCALSLAACSGFQVQTPTRFLELEEDPAYDYRATTADGVVLAVNEHEVDAERGSSVAFWVEAIEGRLRHVGGYALTEKKDVTTQSGLTGTQLRFGRDQGSKPYRYWVTVLVDGDSVFVIEAGGAEDVFEPASAGIEQAIASFEP